jgi:hypothetical protein
MTSPRKHTRESRPTARKLRRPVGRTRASRGQAHEERRTGLHITEAKHRPDTGDDRSPRRVSLLRLSAEANALPERTQLVHGIHPRVSAHSTRRFVQRAVSHLLTRLQNSRYERDGLLHPKTRSPRRMSSPTRRPTQTLDLGIRSATWLHRRRSSAPDRMHHARFACRFARRLHDKEHRPQRGSNDTSHGVRCLSTESTRMIVGTPAYLTDAFRSQGFSPSQRFDPILASRLCFTPHPPIGFRPSELFPPGQPRSLSALRALLPSSQSIEHTLNLNWQASFGRRLRSPDRLRLQSLDPTKRPSPDVTRLARRQAAALLAFFLSEAYQLDRGACALPSCA